MREKPERRKELLFLTVAVLSFTVLYGTLSVARYSALHATTYDLGIITQVVWNTAHGRWFETSLGRSADAELIGSYLGNHVRPFLLLLAPLYRLWPSPRLLLLLQSAALGAAAFPLYSVTRRRTERPMAALIVACCYLAYPALGFLALFDVHPLAFSIPFIFLAYGALQEGKKVRFWIAVLAALSTKEEMVVPLAAWGLINLLEWKRRRTGLGLLALSGAWAACCFGLIIPAYSAGQPYRFWQLWSHLPGIPVRPPASAAGAQTLGHGSAQTVALFLLHLFLPLGFLPFLRPTTLAVAVPSLGYLLLGQRPALHSVGYQYPAVLIPWFFLAVGEGLAWLRRRGGRAGGLRLDRLGLALLLAGTVGTNVVLNPILLYARAGIFRPDPYHPQLVQALAQIPADAGVATINRLGPPLANRRLLVSLEYPPPFRLDHVRQAEYVLLDLVDCRSVPAADQRARYAEMVAQVMRTGDFRVRYWSGRVLLLERGSPTEEEVAAVLAYVDNLVATGRACWP